MFFTNTVSANSTFVARKTSIGMSGNKWWYSSLNRYYPSFGLPNCTAYAYGRLLEINNGVNVGLPMGDAGTWYERTTTIAKGSEPKLGAVICFSKAGDAGHVAVVEEILPNGDVLTSNSAWGGDYFYMKTYSKANGYNNGAYIFQGFIYANVTTTTARYTPLTGDWNGNGVDTIGLYQLSTTEFFLRNSNSGGVANRTFKYGIAGDIPIVGDFNGDGIDVVGVYRPSTTEFFLSDANKVIKYGIAGDIPIVGDFNGDGIDAIGVYRPSTGYFYLSDANKTIKYGNFGDIPIVGDFNGDGIDAIGVYRPSTTEFFLSDANKTIKYGIAGDIPIVGDFNGDGIDAIGVYRPSTGYFYLSDANVSFQYGHGS